MNEGIISNAYSMSYVSEEDTSSTTYNMGGLVGTNEGNYFEFVCSWDRTNRWNLVGQYVGGLVGYNTNLINNSYSNVPVSVGNNSFAVADWLDLTVGPLQMHIQQGLSLSAAGPPMPEGLWAGRQRHLQ